MCAALSPKVGGHGTIIEFKVIPEHGEQVLLKSHDERMHPSVENDIATLKSHLR